MSQVGPEEILSQKQSIQFFKNQLGYEYLGNWRDCNSTMEAGILTEWLERARQIPSRNHQTDISREQRKTRDHI